MGNTVSTGTISMLWEVVPWFWNHRQSKTLPIVKTFFQILRTENPDVKVGVAGFCWGGRYSLLLGQKKISDTTLVEAVFAGHPSLVSIPADVESPICPASIAVASKDSVFSLASAAKTEKLWKDEEDFKYEIVIYEGMDHGFCIRGDMKAEKEKENMNKAVDQVLPSRT